MFTIVFPEIWVARICLHVRMSDFVSASLANTYCFVFLEFNSLIKHIPRSLIIISPQANPTKLFLSNQWYNWVNLILRIISIWTKVTESFWMRRYLSSRSTCEEKWERKTAWENVISREILTINSTSINSIYEIDSSNWMSCESLVDVMMNMNELMWWFI